MRHDGSLNGLWIVQTQPPFTAPSAPPAFVGAPSTPLLARVQNDVYALAFTNAPRATAACSALGAEGKPFYVCRANIAQVVRTLRDVGARGFIVDYDPSRAAFASAHLLTESSTAVAP